jgi:hypothetical protein
MRRKTLQRRTVRLLQGDDAAGFCQPTGFLDEPLGIAGGAGDEAHVHDVERAGRQVRSIGVALPEFDIRRRVPARVLEKRRVHVEADHPAARTDARAQQVGDAARPAADVEAGPALHRPEAVEHGQRIRRHRLRLHMQPLDLARARLDRIVSGERVGHSAVPLNRSGEATRARFASIGRNVKGAAAKRALDRWAAPRI